MLSSFSRYVYPLYELKITDYQLTDFEIKSVINKLKKLPHSTGHEELIMWLQRPATESSQQQKHIDLHRWLRDNKADEDLLPARRIVAFYLADAKFAEINRRSRPHQTVPELTYDNDTVMKFAFEFLFPDTKPHLEKSFKMEKKTFLDGSFVRIGSKKIVLDFAQSPLFEPILKREDINQAINGLRVRMKKLSDEIKESEERLNENKAICNYPNEAANTIESKIRELDQELRITEKIINDIQLYNKPHYNDTNEYFKFAIRAFLKNQQLLNLHNLGRGINPDMPAFIFCAQLAWLITDKNEDDAHKQFWITIFPEIMQNDETQNLPGSCFYSARDKEGELEIFECVTSNAMRIETNEFAKIQHPLDEISETIQQIKDNETERAIQEKNNLKRAASIYCFLAKERIGGAIRYSNQIQSLESVTDGSNEKACRSLLKTDPLMKEAYAIAIENETEAQKRQLYIKAFEQNPFAVSSATGSLILFSSTLASSEIPQNDALMSRVNSVLKKPD